MEQNEKIPFSVLREDYENSVKEYCSIHNCPATTAFKRQFPEFNTDRTHSGGNVFQGNCEVLYVTDRSFTLDDFLALEKEGIEFHTFISKSVSYGEKTI